MKLCKTCNGWMPTGLCLTCGWPADSEESLEEARRIRNQDFEAMTLDEKQNHSWFPPEK